MFQCFYPDAWYGSVYEIDYAAYYGAGYRAVVFDIDNTLVPHGAPADKRSRELFRRLHAMGYGTLLLSNNKEPRVKSFAAAVEADYIYKAGKPSVKNYRRAMRLLETNPSNTLFVGDQLFTDVWGARKAGMRTCLVRPIHPKEEIQIVLKRIPERLVLSFYRRRLEKEAERGQGEQ